MSVFAKNRVSAAAGTLLAFSVLAWLLFSWFEAGTEMHVLCSNFQPGMRLARVLEILETGEYLKYQREDLPSGSRIVVDSLYDLGTTRCIVEFDVEAEVVRAQVK